MFLDRWKQTTDAVIEKEGTGESEEVGRLQSKARVV